MRLPCLFAALSASLFTLGATAMENGCQIDLRASYPHLLLLVGPSGAGKTTLVNRVLKKFNGPLHFVVGVTTRDPRPGEIDGVDYHFWTEERYNHALKQNLFITRHIGPRAKYGDLQSEFEPYLNAGIPILCIVDLDGARTLKGRFPGGRLVLVTTSDVSTARERLVQRKTEGEAERAARIAAEQTFSEPPHDIDHTVITDDLDHAVAQLIGILKSL